MVAKGAIIGFGHIAANGHVPAYLENPAVRIEAVCDSHPDRAELCRTLLPGSRFYSSAMDMLQKEDVDFVDISTPPAFHAEFILQSLSAGKHVLCEKPLVLSQEDLLSIWKASRTAGRTVVTVHNWRYSPILQKVEAILKDRMIGTPEEIEYRVIRTQPSVAVEAGASENWRLDPDIAGGGILVDHGWHAFYLVNAWAGGMPKSVNCTLENRKFHNMQVEDTADVLLDYGHSVGKMFFTWAGASRDNSVFIKGDRGEIKVLDSEILVENDRGTSRISFDQGLSHGSHHADWYTAVINELLTEMQNPKVMGGNFSEAACCLNLLLHCKKSSVSGQTVKIEDWRNNA